jgi:hypothetical protein
LVDGLGCLCLVDGCVWKVECLEELGEKMEWLATEGTSPFIDLAALRGLIDRRHFPSQLPFEGRKGTPGGGTAWRLSSESMHVYPSGSHPPHSGDSPCGTGGCRSQTKTSLPMGDVWGNSKQQASREHVFPHHDQSRCWRGRWCVWLGPVLHCTLPVLALDWPRRQGRLKPRPAHLKSAVEITNKAGDRN